MLMACGLDMFDLASLVDDGFGRKITEISVDGWCRWSADRDEGLIKMLMTILSWDMRMKLIPPED